MEAYSQGVEAARKRVQTAWEGFALIINESGALETAFNALAAAIENIHWIILATIAALTANNLPETITTVTKVFSKLGLVLGTKGLEGKLGLTSTPFDTIKATVGMYNQESKDAFVRQQQMLWGDWLGKFKGNMSDDRFTRFTEYQSSLIGMDRTNENGAFLKNLSVLTSSMGAGSKQMQGASEALQYLENSINEG